MITTEPPATVKVNGSFGLQASIEDQYGNVVTTATNTVAVAFANNPTGATLSGTLSATASQGVATFSGLKINKTGNGYTLQATSSGLSSAISTAINVTKTGTASVVVAQSGIDPPDSSRRRWCSIAPISGTSPGSRSVLEESDEVAQWVEVPLADKAGRDFWGDSTKLKDGIEITCVRHPTMIAPDVSPRGASPGDRIEPQARASAWRVEPP